MKQFTPHPAASRPPSPTRGEGTASSPDAERGTARSSHDERGAGAAKATAGIEGALPSPLVGEGGAARSGAPGEGAGKRVAHTKTPRQVPEPVVFARNLRRHATDTEKKLWSVLRVAPFSPAKFRRQVPIGPYVADFLSYAARLVVEVDGSQHGDARDAKRDAWFEGQGWRVLRFPNLDVNRNMETVTATILSALQFTLTRPLRGHPLPQRGEGKSVLADIATREGN